MRKVEQVILFEKQKKIVRKVAVKSVEIPHPNKSLNQTAYYFVAFGLGQWAAG